jgi:hypothetical protein
LCDDNEEKSMSKKLIFWLAATAALSCTSSAIAADSVGMRIVRDPVTGELRGPTHEEFKELEAQERASAASAASTGKSTIKRVVPAAVEHRPDGSKKALLDESHMSYSVVTRQPDGSLAMDCVTGKDAAQKALSAPPAAAKHDKEHSHEVQ